MKDFRFDNIIFSLSLLSLLLSYVKSCREEKASLSVGLRILVEWITNGRISWVLFYYWSDVNVTNMLYHSD